ncbi:unnamed protein product [Cuscuta campestris]|uniref:Retrovirus-related Pol polyprotein from transposon TNT 1-94-like beta-barrel domain-containing protein n=1 Tax=Cuscuta campestris TaxID=132261 RepID=A0A484NA10_9ASTE|nr:unnamed protein product [Cuscuta campestris]
MVNNMDHGLPKFSLLGYDDWKIMMEAHLYAIHDCMWMVLEDGPLKIQMENPERNPANLDVVLYIPKPKEKWDDRDYKKHNLDNVAKSAIFKTLDPITFSKIKHLKTAMEILQGLGKLCEGSEDLGKQKIEVLLEKFKSFKMLPGESFDMLDERFHKILNDLASLNHILSPKEKNVRLLRSLPTEWYTKSTAMEEGRNLENYTVQGLLDELRIYEHELIKKKEEQVTPFPTALMTTPRVPPSEGTCPRNCDTPPSSQPSSSKMENYDEEFAMMVKQFQKFKKKLGHWKSACPYPKVERYGERERNKKKKKAMVAAESDESSSSSSDEKALVCMERRAEKSNHEDQWTMSEDDTLCLMAKDDVDQEVKSLNKELGIHKSKEAVDKLLEATKQKGREGLGFDPSSSKRKGRTTFIPPKPTAKCSKQKGKEKEKPTEVPKKEAAKYPGVWYLDSGCSRHMTGDASLLSNLIPYDGPRVTFGGSNDFGLTKGLGNLVYKGLTIQAVSYVEGLNYNLLSISRFCDKGYSLEFCKDMASLKNISTNEVILIGKRIRNIYEVMWDDVKEACLIRKDKDEEINEGDRMKHTEFIPFGSLPLKTSQKNLDSDGAEPTRNHGQSPIILDHSNSDNSGKGDSVPIHPESPTNSVLQPEAELDQPVNPNQHNLHWLKDHPPQQVIGDIQSSKLEAKCSSPTFYQSYLEMIAAQELSEFLHLEIRFKYENEVLEFYKNGKNIIGISGQVPSSPAKKADLNNDYKLVLELVIACLECGSGGHADDITQERGFIINALITKSKVNWAAHFFNSISKHLGKPKQKYLCQGLYIGHILESMGAASEGKKYEARYWLYYLSSKGEHIAGASTTAEDEASSDNIPIISLKKIAKRKHVVSHSPSVEAPQNLALVNMEKEEEVTAQEEPQRKKKRKITSLSTSRNVNPDELKEKVPVEENSAHNQSPRQLEEEVHQVHSLPTASPQPQTDDADNQFWQLYYDWRAWRLEIQQSSCWDGINN